MSSSHVFPRAEGETPTAVRAEGAWIETADGRRYIDGAGGAIVVNIGHGNKAVATAVAEQMAAFSYVHASQFNAESLQRYGDELAPYLPMQDPVVFPVSGGSEAVETALKMARAYHLVRGEATRYKIVARWGSYHGNTRGALDASGRPPLRAPYLPWLDKTIHVPAVYEYRCPLASHPVDCGQAHAAELARVFEAEGPETVAAFIAEPIAGATIGASVPTDDYWPAIAEVCKRYGVLVIADEVMTGFGRTGTWFASDHWGLRPDILTAGKGASSGYWPLGLAVASGEVGRTLESSGFVHGFTYSHHAIGAAVGRAVLRVLVDEDLIETSAAQGIKMLEGLRAELGEDVHVGDIRGRGLMIGIELVADRDEKTPFAREAKVTERVTAAAKDAGLTLYPSTGCADGTVGDLVMFGPPFALSDDLIAQMIQITAGAIRSI